MNYNENPAQKKPKGCMFYGCMTLACCALLFLIIGVIAFYKVKKVANSFTAETPVELNVPENVTPETISALESKFQGINESVTASTETVEIRITSEELNMLFGGNPDSPFYKKILLSIDEGKITADVSAPLKGVPIVSDRYLNGSLTLDITFTSGVMEIYATNLVVNNTPLPETFMSQFSKENLAVELYKDPEMTKMLKQIESLEVKDEYILVRVKPGTPEQTTPITQ